MNTDAAPVAEFLIVASIAIDAILILACFALKVLLLATLARLASRNEAEIKIRPTVITTLVIVVLTYVLTVSPDGVIGSYSFFVVAFIATMICKKVFWIEIDKALITGFLFVFLSISLSGYSSRGLNLHIPARGTIESTVADAIDDRTREKTGDESMPSSQRILHAVGQYAADPSEDGKESILDAFLAPIRVGQKAKRQIAEIDKVAAEQASIVNMLSGAGTNVGDRAEELAAFKQGLVDEAGGVAPQTGTSPGKPTGFDPSQSYEAPSTPAPPALADAEESEEPKVELPVESEPQEKAGTFAESVAMAIMSLPAKFRGEDAEEEVPSGEGLRAKRIAKQKQELADATPQGPEATESETPAPTPEKPVSPASASKKISDLALAKTGKKKSGKRAPQAEPVKAKKATKTSQSASPAKAAKVPEKAISNAEQRSNGVPSSASSDVGKKSARPGAGPVGPLSKLDDLEPEERALWKKAHSSIRVSGKGWSEEGGFALVGGEFLRVGGSLGVNSANREFTFRLRGINEHGVCQWEPVIKDAESKDPNVFLAF